MKMKFLGLATIAVMMVGCGGNEPAQSTTQEPKAEPTTEANANTTDAGGETIRIATESSFKPFSYLDNQGNLVGFEIDLANAICAEMKAKCDISSQDWDGLIPGLNANRFDAIMAGMSATEERRQVVDFTEPYFNNTLVFVAKKTDNVTIKDVDGKNVAVQVATVSASYLEKNHPKAVIKTYDKQDNAYLDLTAGRADYMLSDIVPMLDWLKTDTAKNFEVKGSPIDIGDSVAIATRKNDPLTAKFNTAIATLKSNGEYDKIVAKYFDANVLGVAKPANAEAAPPTATTTEAAPAAVTN